jgi:hypothetical protein
MRNSTNAELIGHELAWRRDGPDWVLLHKRRRIVWCQTISEGRGFVCAAGNGGESRDGFGLTSGLGKRNAALEQIWNTLPANCSTPRSQIAGMHASSLDRRATRLNRGDPLKAVHNSFVESGLR